MSVIYDAGGEVGVVSIGDKYGRLVVKKAMPRRQNWAKYWMCQCDCGNTKTIGQSELRNGDTKSCGCLRSKITSKRCLKIETGNRYGRLLVIGPAFKAKNGRYRWACLCDCGNVTRTTGFCLRGGNARSCGCLAKEKSRQGANKKARDRFVNEDFTWYENPGGYIFGHSVYHPLANLNRQFFQHWHIKWKQNPRFAEWARKNKWTIHHKNGKRNDNRLKNLEWRAPGKHPNGWSIEQMIKTLNRAGYSVEKLL